MRFGGFEEGARGGEVGHGGFEGGVHGGGEGLCEVDDGRVGRRGRSLWAERDYRKWFGWLGRGEQGDGFRGNPPCLGSIILGLAETLDVVVFGILQ